MSCVPLGRTKRANCPSLSGFTAGGFSYGGSGDRRYNGSFIVDKSVELGQPLIYVSLNYRVQTLGFPLATR